MGGHKNTEALTKQFEAVVKWKDRAKMDFPEFIELVRRLMDHNVAGINDHVDRSNAAATAARRLHRLKSHDAFPSKNHDAAFPSSPGAVSSPSEGAHLRSTRIPSALAGDLTLTSAVSPTSSPTARSRASTMSPTASRSRAPSMLPPEA